MKTIRLTESELTNLIKNVIKEDTKAAEVEKIKIELRDINMEEDIPNVEQFVSDVYDNTTPDAIISEQEKNVPQEEQNSLQEAKSKLKEYFCSSNDIGKKGGLRALLRKLRERKRQLKAGKNVKPITEQTGLEAFALSIGPLGITGILVLILLVIYLLARLVLKLGKRRTCGGWYS